jgi:hypothetical protein
MERSCMRWVVVVAVFVSCVFACASASAETTLSAEWLVGGIVVTTLTSTEGSSKLILEDAKIKLSMECEGVFDGSVGASGESEVTEVLVGGAAASLAKPIVCKGVGGCSAPAESAPEGLPWHGLLFSTEAGLFREAVDRATVWVMCNILGVLVEEECTIENSTYEVLNITGGVEGMGEITPLGKCTTGGNETLALHFVEGNIRKALTETLSAGATLLAEWLVDGSAVGTLTNTEAADVFILEDATNGLSAVCEGVLDGSVGSNGENEINEVLVGGMAASLLKPIVCRGERACSGDLELAPEDLPWHGLLLLTGGGLFRDAVSQMTIWYKCEIIGILMEEECTTKNDTYEVLNVTDGVEGMGEITPLLTCTSGGNGVLAVDFVAGNVERTLGGVLSVSE